MKHIKLFFLLSLVFVISSCGNDETAEAKSPTDSNTLVGTWILEEFNIGAMDNIPEAEREMMKTMMEGMKGKMKFTFNADGTTSVETNMMGMSDSREGKYQTKGDKIIISEEEGGDQEMTYSISEGKLTLSHSEDGQEISMVLTKE